MDFLPSFNRKIVDSDPGTVVPSGVAVQDADGASIGDDFAPALPVNRFIKLATENDAELGRLIVSPRDPGEQDALAIKVPPTRRTRSGRDRDQC